MIIIGLGVTPIAYTCTCSPGRWNGNALESALEADLVFVGEVVSARSSENILSGPDFEFSVKEFFYGNEVSDTFWVGTPGGSCSFGGFKIGETYLIYANGSDDQFFTGDCAPNRNVLNAESELLLLRENPLPKIPVTLTVVGDNEALWIYYLGGPHQRWRLQSSSNLKDWTDIGEEFYGFYRPDQPGHRLLLSNMDPAEPKQFFSVREVTE